MTTLLIDGNNLLSRAIFGASGMTTSDEQWNTAPLVAFVGSLSRLVKIVRPDQMVVCWDWGPSVMRRELYPAYKASRNEHPDADEDMVKDTHFAFAKRMLQHCGIQQVAIPGFEADDVIAAYWAARKPEDMEAMYIASGDKDFHQLLDHGVTQIRPIGAGASEEWGYQQVQDKYGCPPRHLPLMMALMGDAIDGVPGVRGIGPKKALKALQKADWVLGEVDVLQDAENRRMALLSLALVDLRDTRHHPTVPPLRSFQPVSPGDGKAFVDLLVFLRALELESIVNKIFERTLWSS